MPYIKRERRDALWCESRTDHDNVPRTAGELNYWLTEQVIYYLDQNGSNYQAYNDVLGALEGCKLELYRRRIAPYEDVKIEENGDVYDKDQDRDEIHVDPILG